MPRHRVRHLLQAIGSLQSEASAAAAVAGTAWAAVPASARVGIENLAAYLVLRRHDLSDLQPALSALGLSSLGRSEAHVLTSLEALRATLARIAGDEAPAYPDAAAMEAGPAALAAARDGLFGAGGGGIATRIMVTLPPEAATDRTLVRGLVEAGMDCARINCAHDDAEAWTAMAAAVREEARAAGRECRVLMDIGGPKCRIETVHAADKARLFRGDRFVIVAGMQAARSSDEVILTINFPEILDQLAPGREVWINDGKLGCRVVAMAAGRVELEVHSTRSKGMRIRAEKGVNFPDTELHLDPLTPKDLADLATVAALADLVGFSFVQRPEDLDLLHAAMAPLRPGLRPLPVVLKIETPLAVRNLPGLLARGLARGAVAVMIARGDLAVELGFARMSEVQEEIMWLCEAAHVPVIWATQVLENMVAEGMPSRAETTDAAMSQRAECVMLNKGPYLAEGVRFLADVLGRMERHQAKKVARLGPLHSWSAESLVPGS